MSARHAKHYDEAIEILTVALNRFPDSLRIRLEFANVYRGNSFSTGFQMISRLYEE